MVDAVCSVAKIVGVALKIREAATTARQNKKDCHHIKCRVDVLNKTLSHHENNADLMEDPAVMAALEALDGILAEALEVIAECQEERNIVCVYCTAGKLSRQLSKMEQRVSYLSSDAMLTIMSYHLLRNREGAPHQLPQIYSPGKHTPLQPPGPPQKMSKQNQDEAKKKEHTQTSRPQEDVTVPPFGKWDAGDAASGEKYTGIFFYRVTDDKLSPDSSSRQQSCGDHRQENKVEQQPHIPAFGDWENSENVPYTQKFEGARKITKTGVYANPNEPGRLPEPPRKSTLNPSAYTPDPGEQGQRTPLHGRRPANDPHHHESAPRRQTNPQREQLGDGSPPRIPYRYGAGSASPMESNSPSKPKGRAAGMQTPERRSDAHGQHTPGRSRMRQSNQGYNPEGEVAVAPFGEWDVGDAASGEKFTGIFNRVREDKLSPDSSARQQSSGDHRQENKVEQAPPRSSSASYPAYKMVGELRSLVHRIAEVAGNIKAAVETVLQNREECLEIGDLVNKVSTLLSQLMGKNMLDEPAMRVALEKLIAAFRRAHTLVVACQRRGLAIVWLFSLPGRLSSQLHEVMEQIASSIADMTAIVLT